MSAFKDITGIRFGQLTVICLAEQRDKYNRSYWRCRCDCGTEKVVTGGHLRTGHTKSCGSCGPRSPVTKENMLEKFESKYVLEPSTGCWIWTGCLGADGYGKVEWDYLGGDCRAHRLSWLLFKGEIPKDKPVVCHTCNNPRCVNPEHLEAGTQKGNLEYMVAQGRQAKGERNGGGGKLTEAEALVILNDPRAQSEIARDYGVTPTTVCNIKKGKIWKHLPRVI